MRARAIGIFLFGLLAGAFCLYYVLWRTGGLVPGHPLTLTTRELIGHPTIAVPTPIRAALPAPVATPLPASAEPTTTPTPLPVDSERRSVAKD